MFPLLDEEAGIEETSLIYYNQRVDITGCATMRYFGQKPTNTLFAANAILGQVNSFKVNPIYLNNCKT